MILAPLIIASLFAVAYAAFSTGVFCASNRQLRLVFVRVLALLGIVTAGGTWVSVLRAEAPDSPGTEVDQVTAARQAAEIVVDAFGQIDEQFVDRYTDLEQLMSVDQLEDEVVADEVEVAIVPAVEEQDSSDGGIPIDCAGVENVHGILNDTVPVSIAATEPPAWFGKTPSLRGAGEHCTAVESGPWLTDVEAETALNDVIHEAVAEYVDDQIGRRGAARKIRLSARDIALYRIVQDRYADEYESSVGTMQRKHAKLVFTPEFRRVITERWQEHLVAHRLFRTGIGISVVMALLFMSLGVFKRLASPIR